MPRTNLSHAPLRALACLVLVGLALTGCGKKDKADVVVAKVGDRDIRLDYFERKMNTMDPKFLPTDVNSREGREELLEVMIDKEVMAIKAEELGMGADGAADEQAEVVSELTAVMNMRDDVVAPYQSPSEDEIQEYYENFARVLDVSYMLFDHVEEAREARALVAGGEPWAEVAARYEAGDPGPTKDYRLRMKYGTVADDLEKIVFELPVGEVSQPIDSLYGFFVVRVEGQSIERVPPLDTIRDKVVASVVKQNSALAIQKFTEEVFEEFDFFLDDEVLELVFTAFPEDVPLDPPPSQDQLKPLNLRPADLDRVLMSYADQTWTVRRYSDLWDQTSAYGRPRTERRLGTFRRYLKEIAIRDLMPLAAHSHGYMEDEEVKDEFKERREQAMVTMLHQQLVEESNVKVLPAEVEEYYAEHAEEFDLPERRQASAIICESEEDALAAQLELQNGASWDAVLQKYCVDQGLKAQGGDLGLMRADTAGPVGQNAFRLARKGDVSFPSQLDDGRWVIVKVTQIMPAEDRDLDDVRVRIGKILETQKQEKFFRERMNDWKAEMPIERFPEHLMDAVFDPEPQSDAVPIRTGA